ncbi:class II aaRS and biotin synthetase [Rhizopogon salebrosus TDB-379]|nr:class II aaRS and biotin synthetase [Rhizopogon salebrosus TDB-379]
MLLSRTLYALGLRFSARKSDSGPQLRILPQLLLAHPDSLYVQHRVVEALHDHLRPGSTISHTHVDGEIDNTFQHRPESFVFEDANDVFHFHFPSLPSADEITDLSSHPIIELIPRDSPSFVEKVKHVLVLPKPLTSEHENMYTPHFSPSAFFRAIDEFRSGTEGTTQSASQDSWRIGDALMYGEAVSSTQTMFDKNPSFLRALPVPIVSLASIQLAGRGRGGNLWLSPAGCMQLSLKIRIGLKGSSSVTYPAIRPSNLVFIQYLYALAVVDACHALDPSSQWAHKIRLKWPNDIYGLFPSDKPGSKLEPRKLGGILVNTSFGGGVADVVIGSGLNVLNEPPIASLAQLTPSDSFTSGLSVERAAAAVLTSFERIWDSFLQQEEQGFQPFMDQYLRSWLHSDQLVTLATRTPHRSVRIIGITPDYGLLRTMPLNGGEFIDLQPDGNSFDMMKGLISTKKQ